MLSTGGNDQDLIGPKSGLVGRRGVFRQVWIGSPWPGFDSLLLDDVKISQQEGPVDVREVLISQLPTPGIMTWQKAHHVKRVGSGSYVTLVELDVEIEDELIAKDMVDWSRRCAAAAGAVACLLDERGLYQRVAENLIVYDAVGAVVGVADHTIGVRNFGVDREPPRPIFDSAAGLTEELRVAARWFLHGVQKGPSEAGVLMLATATESLVNDTEKGKNTFSPNAIRQAFESAGGSEVDLRLDIGRCAGLRARIVHTGTEDDEELQRGWYSLERIVRTILTNRLDITTTWPVDPSDGVEKFADLDLRERLYEYGELQSG